MKVEAAKRETRWKCFQIAFVVTYAGIVLDVITTALGYRLTGASYEQNPLGAGVISQLGWVGVLGILTGLCAVAYISSRTVFQRMNLRWAAVLNFVLLPIMVFRWLAVITATAYIIQQIS